MESLGYPKPVQAQLLIYPSDTTLKRRVGRFRYLLSLSFKRKRNLPKHATLRCRLKKPNYWSEYCTEYWTEY